MNGVAVVCFALVFVGVGLSVASLVTPYWIQWKFKYRDTIYQHNGLWKFCQDGNCTTSYTSDILRLGGVERRYIFMKSGGDPPS